MPEWTVIIPKPTNEREDWATLRQIMGRRVKATSYFSSYEMIVHGYVPHASNSEGRMQLVIRWRHWNTTTSWSSAHVSLNNYQYVILE